MASAVRGKIGVVLVEDGSEPPVNPAAFVQAPALSPARPPTAANATSADTWGFLLGGIAVVAVFYFAMK